jgi:hypothetical protein
MKYWEYVFVGILVIAFSLASITLLGVKKVVKAQAAKVSQLEATLGKGDAKAVEENKEVLTGFNILLNKNKKISKKEGGKIFREISVIRRGIKKCGNDYRCAMGERVKTIILIDKYLQLQKSQSTLKS